VSGKVQGGEADQLKNASWPLSLPIRRAGTVVHVRYDLIFDAGSRLHVERLGEDAPRQIAPTFTNLSVTQKKAALIREFGLAAVIGRPAFAGSRATATKPEQPARAAAAWTAAELDQVKAVYDRLPAADRAALTGVTLVRDHSGPPPAAGDARTSLAGVAHIGDSPEHDDPAPPSHRPPHIHYYDTAFLSNAVSAVGAPGSSGPGADQTIAHEVGHFRVFQATISANAAIAAANAKVTATGARLNTVLAHPLKGAQFDRRDAWLSARNAAASAIFAFNTAVAGTAPAPASSFPGLIAAAAAAVATRDTARAALAGPADLVAVAAATDSALDALFTATRALVVAADQVPIYIELAGTFGFAPPTAYARTGDDDFFAETFALYINDPDRLNRLNRSIFLWFQAGMPMDRKWAPPAALVSRPTPPRSP
jgi:hypothetical protein